MSSITAVPRFSSLRTTRLIPFFVVAAVLGRADQAASATLTVCNTGCDHATIAGALAAATANDTVSVLDTVHTEANVAVATAVTIEGKGAAQTTVQAAVTRLAGLAPCSQSAQELLSPFATSPCDTATAGSPTVGRSPTWATSHSQA